MVLCRPLAWADAACNVVCAARWEALQLMLMLAISMHIVCCLSNPSGSTISGVYLSGHVAVSCICVHLLKW